ncbi:hypothetical protein H0H87_000846 [Tephrocybe sp. NHM501043]|nr:hypothetical protein H0H87_000846 [Tephrocybe sp. NHM501043]
MLCNDLEKLFKEYAVQDNIDTLHRVINEAKERKTKDEVGKDVWRENLEPRAAVSARTVPIMELEVKRLRDALVEIQEENRVLQAQMEANVQATENAKKSTEQLLDKLDMVYEEWQGLPTEEIEGWTVQTMESLKPQLLP